MECHAIMGLLAVHVMPKGDEIVVVGKGHYTFGVMTRNRKETLENIADTLPQFRVEIVQNKMGIRF